MLVSHLISVVDITIAGGTALTLRSLQTPPSALLGVAAVTRREHRYLLSSPSTLTTYGCAESLLSEARSPSVLSVPAPCPNP